MARETLNQGEVDALVNEFETKLGRLRSLYEQYFMGIERTPPRTLRKDVVRLLNRLEHIHVQNTATKFKIRSLVQRFNSFKAYWNRCERQIEEGTFPRDRQRAQRNQQRRERREASQEQHDILELDLEEIGEIADLQAELEAMEAAGDFDRRPSEPQRPAASAPPADPQEAERRKNAKLAEIASQLGIDSSQSGAPKKSASEIRGTPVSSGSSNGRPGSGSARGGASLAEKRQRLSEMKKKFENRTGRNIASDRGGSSGDEARRVYNQLLEAKKRCNESTKGLTYEAVSKSMEKQRESLQQKRGASDVEFKVVIKNGKAFLKPETK